MEKGMHKQFKAMRIKRGLTQEEVSFHCEMNAQHYTRIEKGEIAPSEEDFTRISSFFHVTEDELRDLAKQNRKKVSKTLNILHIVQSVLLLCCFFLPFNISTPLSMGREMTGFDLLLSSDFEDYFIVKIVFAVLIIQLILHLVILIKKIYISAIYKIAVILTNIIIGVFLYVDWVAVVDETPAIAYVVILTTIGVLMSLFELVKFDQGHDFLTDTYQMRKVVLGTSVFVYLMFLVQSYDYFFVSYNALDTSENLFLIVWISYIVVFPFLRKTFYESRLWVSLYILLAPISLLMLVITYGETEPVINFVLLMMCLPILLVNLDLVSVVVKDSIQAYKEK